MSKQELWGVDISDAAWLNLCPSNVRPFDCMPPPYSEVTVCIHICPDTYAVMWKRKCSQDSMHSCERKKKYTPSFNSMQPPLAATTWIIHFLYDFIVFYITLEEFWPTILYNGAVHWGLQTLFQSLNFDWANAIPGPIFLFQSFCCKLLLWFWIIVLLYDSILAKLSVGAVGQTEDRAPLHHCA